MKIIGPRYWKVEREMGVLRVVPALRLGMNMTLGLVVTIAILLAADIYHVITIPDRGLVVAFSLSVVVVAAGIGFAFDLWESHSGPYLEMDQEQIRLPRLGLCVPKAELIGWEIDSRRENTGDGVENVFYLIAELRTQGRVQVMGSTVSSHIRQLKEELERVPAA